MESTSSNRKEKLLEFFSKYDTTLDIFIFLRLVVAIEICSHEEVYEPLIPGSEEITVWKIGAFGASLQLVGSRIML